MIISILVRTATGTLPKREYPEYACYFSRVSETRASVLPVLKGKRLAPVPKAAKWPGLLWPFSGAVAGLNNSDMGAASAELPEAALFSDFRIIP